MSVPKHKRIKQAQDAAKARVFDERMANEKRNRLEKARPDPKKYFEEYTSFANKHGLKTYQTDFSRFRRTKTQDANKLRVAVASFTFGKYSTPNHLQEVFAQPRMLYRIRFDGGIARPFFSDFDFDIEKAEEEYNLRFQWFICAAMGGSLFKQHTNGLLTKKETHVFLNCPFDLTFSQALVYALASGWTDNIGVRKRLALSKLSSNPTIASISCSKRYSEEHLFFKEVIRFFATNEQLSIHQVNDLYDFFYAKFPENYCMKGRTLQSAMHQMEQWHRDLARITRLGNHKWSGIDIPDKTYIRDHDTPWVMKNQVWSFKQILNSKELGQEGNVMRHCVYSYQKRCVYGTTSIWSLRLNDQRTLTLEVNNTMRSIVQIRGLANRLAKKEEMVPIRVWASENGLIITDRF